MLSGFDYTKMGRLSQEGGQNGQRPRGGAGETFGFTLIRLAFGQPPSPVRGKASDIGSYPTPE